MRISDWSSDVCSSDLPGRVRRRPEGSRAPPRRAARRPDAARRLDPECRTERRPRRLPRRRKHHLVGLCASVAARPAGGRGGIAMMAAKRSDLHLVERLPPVRGRYTVDAPLAPVTWFRVGGPAEVLFRSEEHTSELQSLMRISYAVFALKKK